jgi:integrase
MASFRKRGGQQWQARIRRNGFPDIVKTFRTKADAEIWSRSRECELDLGVYIDRAETESRSLGDLVRRYRREITPQKRGSQSEDCRLRAIERDALSAIKVAAITSTVIAAWRDKRLKFVSGSTVARDLNLLGHVIQTARREWGIHLPDNPVHLVRKPKSNRPRERRLLAGEEARLLACMESDKCRHANGEFVGGISRNPCLRPVVILAIETAMRQSELVSLCWENINLDTAVAILPITKNGERRAVPLSRRSVTTLAGLPRSGQGRVFVGLTAEAVKRAFARTVKSAGMVDLRFHDLRHEATSRLFERNLNPLEVAAITGHKTLQMLKRYTHFAAEELAKKLG